MKERVIEPFKQSPANKCLQVNHHSNVALIYLHDLEGAVGCVEELELFDGPLRNRVEGGPTPAPLYQADGLCCKDTTRKIMN